MTPPSTPTWERTSATAVTSRSPARGGSGGTAEPPTERKASSAVVTVFVAHRAWCVARPRRTTGPSTPPEPARASAARRLPGRGRHRRRATTIVRPCAP
jgi:hypothetical protein